MKPTRIVLVERLALVGGLVAIVVAAASVEWRVGLFLAGLVLVASALDVRRGR
jgi:hypothetical protein